jgi:iron(III) transport system substrate-binding protein
MTMRAARRAVPGQSSHTVQPLCGFLLSALVALGAAVFAPVSANAQSADLLAAAKKEGEIVWYSSHQISEAIPVVAKAFAEKYPDLKLTVVGGTSTTVFQKFMQDVKMGAPRADVISTGTPGNFVDLKQKGMLAQYKPENFSQIDPLFQQYSNSGDNYYFATQAAMLGIAYNSDKVTDADAPKLWTDLLDPKWQGQVAMGDLGSSGLVAEWGAEMNKAYGWQYFDKLIASHPLVGRSVVDGVTSLVSGERLVSPTVVGVALDSAHKGNPIKVSFPKDGVVLVMMPSAILKDAPHPNGARLLMEFLLGKEYAAATTSTGYRPARDDVPLAAGQEVSPDLKFLTMPAQESMETTKAVVAKWRETFGK